ncbi:MAG: YeiH family protein [Defluviitaleaceae bacterium]|nr:YeiH family protein [Defluviitaleaceae bacterium]
MTVLYILLALLITLPITGVSYYSAKNLRGALLCLSLAVPAFFLGRFLPLAGGPVIGILLGMLAALFRRVPAEFKAGAKETGKRVLQTAIVLFGFQMNLTYVLDIGWQSVPVLLAVVAAALILAVAVGRKLGLSPNEQTLIGVGTAICGGSAIAATAPIIKADDNQVATSISIIFLFNVIAVFVFPALGHILGLDDTRFGIWAGAAINDTSSVVAAGFSYSEAAGNTATVVKLSRTLMIIPISLALAMLQARREQGGGKFSLVKSFPWFVAGFLAACIVNTAGVVPTAAAAFWGDMGRFLIIVAMVGIGLGVSLPALLTNSKKPVILGGCLSLTVAAVSLAIIL